MPMNDFCQYAKKCSACQLCNLTYPEQLRLKENICRRHIGGLCRVEAITPSPKTGGYRNKAQFVYKRDGKRIVAGVYIGTGLGNAVCIDGRAYRGATGSACELGHIPVAGLTEDCGCGKKGCIELKASGRNLQRIADGLHCPVGEVFIRHAEDEKVQEFITMAAIAIATEVTILDPVCVVLGGGVVGMPGFPLKTLTERVKENLRVPDPRASFKLELSSGDPEAGVVGAVINAVTLGR